MKNLNLSRDKRPEAESFPPAHQEGHSAAPGLARPAHLPSKPPFDHSQTYRRLRVRNIPHRRRLADIKRLIKDLGVPAGGSYADFGCSNGYITDQVRELVKARQATGFDYLPGHFVEGRRRHPALEFEVLDLNIAHPLLPTFDLVTCFETLEHIGHLEHAVGNLLRSIRPGGIGVISVPVETGMAGFLKFAAKTAFYGGGLKELPQRPDLWRAYFLALLRNDRIGGFRSERRNGWSTHFGFDARDIDDLLDGQRGVTAHPRPFNKFWVIRKPA